MIPLLILAAGAAALELKRLAKRPQGAEETRALLEKEKHLTQVLQVILWMHNDRNVLEHIIKHSKSRLIAASRLHQYQSSTAYASKVSMCRLKASEEQELSR